jgi:histidinol dehydrogenase
MNQQRAAQRTEREAAGLLQRANAQIEEFQSRRKDLQHLIQQNRGTFANGIK